MYQVTLKTIVSFNKWMSPMEIFIKKGSIAIPPVKGMEIEGLFVDYIETTLNTKEIICNMLHGEAYGQEEVFNEMCETLINNGWIKN